MTLNVLRDGQEMMKLVRYNVLNSTDTNTGDDTGSLNPESGSSETPNP